MSILHHNYITLATIKRTTYHSNHSVFTEEQVSECPSSCHGRGDCVDGSCQCFPGYDGWDCAQSKLP